MISPYNQTGTGIKSILISVALFLLTVTSCTRSVPEENRYLGMTPPGNIPLVLPLSVNKGCFAAERIAVSNDGREIYYSEIRSYYPVAGDKIKRYTFSDGKWNGPFDMFAGFGPALSQNGDTMYFERMNAEDKATTYFSVRKKTGWSDPKRILTKLEKAHYYHVTRSGNKYISSLAGNGAGLSDWCRIVIKGADTTTLSLGRPLNTSGENQDFFIAADESYMIVTNRPALAISYRNSDGSWTNPRNLGAKINFGLGSWGPWVTPDNKYLFYSTGTKPDYSDVAVYWVRIDGVIDSLKNTNLSPYVTTLIENQTAVAGRPFNYSVPENIFKDEDSNAPLTYSAQMPDGKPLPAWISFNSETRTFSGTPVETGEIITLVVVSDAEKGIAYGPLKISVIAGSVKK